MDLSINDHRHLMEAQGFIELGMFDDALKTLDTIEPGLRTHPVTLKLRLSIFFEAKRWKEAAKLGKTLCKEMSQDGGVFIQTAYCLHELQETQKAKETLLSGPESLRNEAVFHYNLGCYEAQLGNLEAAKPFVSKAIEMDKSYKKMAQEDPDLKPLRKSDEAAAE
jgi:tetratricopeptide (TPR) repeat protein